MFTWHLQVLETKKSIPNYMLFYLIKYFKESVPDMRVVFYELIPNKILTRAIHLLSIEEPSQYTGCGWVSRQR